MSKTEVKNDINEPRGQNVPVDTTPYSETTQLGGPKPRLGPGPAPCSLTLSHEALKVSGIWPGYKVEVMARPGEILVKLIGGPKPSAWDRPRQPNPGIIDELMVVTKEREARHKAAREGIPYDPYEGDEEPEEMADGLRDEESQFATSEPSGQNGLPGINPTAREQEEL